MVVGGAASVTLVGVLFDLTALVVSNMKIVPSAGWNEDGVSIYWHRRSRTIHSLSSGQRGTISEEWEPRTKCNRER